MTDCVFCKIAKKELPSNIVYEDSDTIAFLDRSPVNKGHTLVIPKKHSVNILDIDDKELEKVMLTVKKVSIALSKLWAGVNLEMNNNRVAGQIVDHFHIHVIPRFVEDGLKHWPGKKYEGDEDKKTADLINKKVKEVN